MTKNSLSISDITRHRLWLCLAGSLLIHIFFLFSNPYKSINSGPISKTKLRATIAAKKDIQKFHVSKSAVMPASPAKKKPAINEPPRPPKQAPATPVAVPTPLPIPAEIPMDDYVDPDTVDQKASAIDVPELPPPTDIETAPGLVRIKVFINLSGHPDYVEVLETTLPEAYVTVLTDVFRRSKFSPALQGEKAVNSWRMIEILYGEPEAAETPVPTQ